MIFMGHVVKVCNYFVMLRNNIKTAFEIPKLR